jgi:hypothetical protein
MKLDLMYNIINIGSSKILDLERQLEDSWAWKTLL